MGCLERPIAFNSQYMGDALATFGSDAVSIRYTKAVRGLFLCPESVPDEAAPVPGYTEGVRWKGDTDGI